MSDLGLSILDELRNRIQVDDCWSIPIERGYTWWPHRLAQHVWVEEGVYDRGIALFRIHIRTDVWKGFDGSDSQLELINNVSRYPTMSGLVRNPSDPTRIQFASSFYVHVQNRFWLVPTLLMGSALSQAAEAIGFAMELGKAVGLEADYTEHPENGPRFDRDSVIDNYISHIETNESTCDIVGMFDALDKSLEANEVMHSTGERCLVAEVPFADFTSMIKLTYDFHHDIYGNGILITHSLPVPVSKITGHNGNAIPLIACETCLRDETWAHEFGSWYVDDLAIRHHLFVPSSLIAEPTMIHNLYMSERIRSSWAERYFFSKYNLRELNSTNLMLHFRGTGHMLDRDS